MSPMSPENHPKVCDYLHVSLSCYGCPVALHVSQYGLWIPGGQECFSFALRRPGSQEALHPVWSGCKYMCPVTALHQPLPVWLLELTLVQVRTPRGLGDTDSTGLGGTAPLQSQGLLLVVQGHTWRDTALRGGPSSGCTWTSPGDTTAGAWGSPRRNDSIHRGEGWALKWLPRAPRAWAGRPVTPPTYGHRTQVSLWE